MWNEVIGAWWVWAVPVAFVAVLFYAFNPKRKKEFAEDARLPLDDDQQKKG